MPGSFKCTSLYTCLGFTVRYSSQFNSQNCEAVPKRARIQDSASLSPRLEREEDERAFPARSPGAPPCARTPARERVSGLRFRVVKFLSPPQHRQHSHRCQETPLTIAQSPEPLVQEMEGSGTRHTSCSAGPANHRASTALRVWRGDDRNHPERCSSEQPTRGTVCGTMRSMCGPDAGCSAINYQSLSRV